MLRAAILAFALAAPAWAGCPPEQAGAGFHQDGPRESSGVESETLVSYDLAPHYGIAARGFRIRRLTVAPGGVIGLHEHSTRPGGGYVASGTMTEYRDSCAVGLVYAAGAAVSENAPLSHWWRNEGGAPAVVIVFDLPPH